MAGAVRFRRRRRKGEPTMNGNRPLMVLAGIAVGFLLYLGEPFFVPLFVSLLISYALSPVVDAMTLVVRWMALAAGLVVSAGIGVVWLAADLVCDAMHGLGGDV